MKNSLIFCIMIICSVISYTQGKPKCKDPNEVMKSDCPRVIEPTCADNYPLNEECDEPKCVCQRGYFRLHEGGRCVSKIYCDHHVSFYDKLRFNPRTCNDPNEIYVDCAPDCQGTCEYPNGVLPRQCSRFCRPGCICRQGFVRGPDNKCVDYYSC